MVPYELTPAAEADLREVARYTLRQWGVRQQRRYARQLEACFRGIADGRLRSRDFSERYPGNTFCFVSSRVQARSFPQSSLLTDCEFCKCH